MRSQLAHMLKRAVGSTRMGKHTYQYLPYAVPGLAAVLHGADTLHHQITPARSLDKLQRVLGTSDIEHHQPCPLCGADSVRLLYRPSRRTHRGRLSWEYRAGRCRECGLLYRVPAIKPECVPSLYTEGSYSTFLEGKYIKGRKGKYERTLKAFEPFFDAGDGRRLLDFGCGTGAFVELALARGFDAIGVDLSPDAVEFAQKRIGPDRVWCGDPLDIPQIAKGGFDVITMWSVIAHFAEPKEQLQKLRGLLAPGGVLLVYTVNAGSLELKAYRDAWRSFTKNHLVFWDPKTLTRLLKEVGFEDVVYRPFYGAAVESGSGTLTPAQRHRVRRHVDRHHSGSMLRAMAVNGPVEMSLEYAAPLEMPHVRELEPVAETG